MDRTEQDLCPGLKAGPAARRGTAATTGITAARLTSQRDSPADQPRARTPKPSRSSARYGKTTQLRRRVVGGQRCSYSPVQLGFRGNTSARSCRGSRRSQMLRESPRDAMGASETPLGGWRELARSNLGDVVLEPLHPPFWPLSISKQVVVLCFSVLPLFSSSAHLLSWLNKCWSAPVNL